MSQKHSSTATDRKAGPFSALAADLPASLVVFLVALPLSLGIALASGAPLMSGLIAAIIGGIVIGMAGGAPLQVSGPAAGLTVIVYGYIQQYGWGVTCAITVGAGLLQLALGAAGVAPLALGMSPAVIHGMLAAIGILIALSQIHVVLGAEPGGKGLKNLMLLPESVAGMDLMAAVIGGIAIAILAAWPYLPARLRAIPGPLVAVLAATAVSLALGLQVPRVELGGDLFSSISLPALPTGNFASILGAVVALCFVASAESLLCAVATDKLHTGPRANLHKELMGQGLGNTLSGLLGGLPVTGVIVRSSANIGAGGKTRLSPILHGVWVLIFVALFPGVITMVPLAALAGLLVYTGIKLVNPHHIRELRRRGELWVYLVTVVAIVSTNLLLGLGIGFGVALARLLWKLTHAEVHVAQNGARWRVTVDGTLTFTAVPKLTTRLAAIPAGAEVEIDLAVRYLDHAGFDALNSWRQTHEKLGGKVHLEQLEEIWERSNARARRLGDLHSAEVPA
ncbi:MAG: SulP family inorganic anion transporter [Armatimonadota bacterium]